MANRSYLYSLSNRPAAYADRPETISGLSEWPYDVPFMYRLLMSGDPQPCASLVSDGMEDEEPGSKTRLYAISGVFEPGYARVRRFADIVRAAVAQAPAPAPGSTTAASASGASQPASFMDRVKQMFSPQADAAPTPVPASPAAPASDQLLAALDETLAFLDAHRDSHLLLETIELDIMSHAGEAELKACVDAEIARCRRAGAALDALPANVDEAARALRTAVAEPAAEPLDAFHGLRLDNDFDSTRSGATEHPLGLYWSDVLYFELFNRSQFEAHLRQG
ncbi:hypothetical protein KDH83_12770 [Achromobacter sp. Marseille-Q0513]|uniref:DUF7822 domain-containing protein n=1 Tax=Achromobacter sp. Marseille-Q0513 TaxID=2829161 RepID=UPI001B95DCEF|nr:hypothetical protein [Achromobacter sp. Marseille-Q0513]MBR8654166.1 hypothetical protein [Achromobacter sp. Marseille-Q0513]